MNKRAWAFFAALVIVFTYIFSPISVLAENGLDSTPSTDSLDNGQSTTPPSDPSDDSSSKKLETGLPTNSHPTTSPADPPDSGQSIMSAAEGRI